METRATAPAPGLGFAAPGGNETIPLDGMETAITVRAVNFFIGIVTTRGNETIPLDGMETLLPMSPGKRARMQEWK